MGVRFDALNGSLIGERFLASTLDLARPFALGVTINNLRRITPSPTLEEALTDLADYRRILDRLSAQAFVLRTPEDWTELAAGERVGILLGYQNAGFVGDRLELLDLLHALGVRSLQITHNDRNPYGSGCAVDDDGGLTPLGHEFVRACNALGVVIDCSHTGERTTIEVAEVSAEPVTVTHSNCRAVLDHPRNKSDRAIRAVAASGGVIGVTFLPALVSTADRPSFGELLEHVAHAVELVGEDAVGFGSDFTEGQSHDGRYAALDRHSHVAVTGNWNYPIAGLGGLDVLAEALSERGIAPEKLLGANFERVFSTAARSRTPRQEIAQ